MGKFITDQILGMKWLNTLIGNLLGTLGLDATSRIGGSIQFFGKKKEEQKKPCCCGGSCTPEVMQAAEAEKKESGIKILGGGCAKCNALEAETEEALRELGMDATIDHVRDFEKIAAYGVMTTPALVVDGQVVSYGKVLKKDEVISILKKVRA